jgi:hypothetical protein
MVTEQSVERACSEVGEYSDEKLVGEFERFFRQQPAICDFVVELTHGSGQKIQELSLFLSYMIFKTMEIDAPAGVSSVTPERVEAAYHESQTWIERISQVEGSELQSTLGSSLQKDTEPYLLQYVISELNEPLEDGATLDDEEKGEVFFVLKTVISSLKGEQKGRIIEVQ